MLAELGNAVTKGISYMSPMRKILCVLFTVLAGLSSLVVALGFPVWLIAALTDNDPGHGSPLVRLIDVVFTISCLSLLVCGPLAFAFQESGPDMESMLTPQGVEKDW